MINITHASVLRAAPAAYLKAKRLKDIHGSGILSSLLQIHILDQNSYSEQIYIIISAPHNATLSIGSGRRFTGAAQRTLFTSILRISVCSYIGYSSCPG